MLPDHPPVPVYFAPIEECRDFTRIERRFKDLLNCAEFEQYVPDKGLVAVKTHFGEKNSITHIPPRIFKPLAARIKQAGGRPFLTETSTLYKGSRSDTIVHCELAHNHGFTLENTAMPVIMSDGLNGGFEAEIAINGELCKKVAIAGLLPGIHGLVCASHPTGHVKFGFGGAIKNLGMGLSSRKGKMTMHSSIKPYIKPEKCAKCGYCMQWCPEDAIIEINGIIRILGEKCIGCGECLTQCRFDAVAYNWETGSEEIQKLTAEHALGVVKGKKVFFINYFINFTKDCDCFGTAKTPIIRDFGILASPDPVAIDTACLDLIEQREKRPLNTLTYPGIDPRIQVQHAEKIGLGSQTYKIITC